MVELYLVFKFVQSFIPNMKRILTKPRLVVFSGAGMSAESGIRTFRDTGGLWEDYSIEDVATPAAWERNPALVQAFYNTRRKQIIETKPNTAHRIVQALEENFDVQVITQNIDDLHERAGSTNVLHLHGNIRYAKSSGPNPDRKLYPIKGWELKLAHFCDNGYPLRPHVVWFGEEVPKLETAAQLISTADYLLVVGTSLHVYPAAGLVHLAPAHAEKWIIDPNADELVISDDFSVLKMGAEKGLEIWQKNGELSLHFCKMLFICFKNACCHFFPFNDSFT